MKNDFQRFKKFFFSVLEILLNIGHSNQTLYRYRLSSNLLVLSTYVYFENKVKSTKNKLIIMLG